MAEQTVSVAGPGPTVGRVPPNDLEAEATVISALLLDSDAYDDVSELLEPLHCYADANRLILEAVWDLRLASRPSDMVSVAGWLRDRGKLAQVGGAPYIGQIVDATPAVANVVEHARTIREKWRLRQIIQVCQRFAADGYGYPGDVQQFIDRAEQAVFDVAHWGHEGRDISEAHQVVSECLRIAQAAAEAGTTVTGTALGLSELDRKTTGAHAGELYVIAGRPGQGKTALATCMALSVARPRATGLANSADQSGDATEYTPGKGVLYCSLEMPREQIGQRLIATEGRVDITKIRSGRMVPDEWSRFMAAGSVVSKMPIWIDDTPGASLLQVRAKARRVKRQCLRSGVDFALLVVDYLGLMTSVAQSREQEISTLSRGLKQLAKELEIPVLALAQLNRECEKRPDKRPQLSDLRDSGGIEQDADVVVFVYRDEQYHKDSPDRGIAELIIAKQRMGPVGVVKTKFTKEWARFDNLVYGGYDEFDDRADEPSGDWYP